MNRSLVTLGISLLIASSAIAAKIDHTPLSCVAEADNAKIVATIDDASSARVYFRAAGEETEYWVEMRQGADGKWWAALPLLCRQSAVTYRIAARNGAETDTTPEYNVPLSSGCAGFTLSDEERAIADNMVVGVSRVANGDADDKKLRGFRCKGVVQRVSMSGEMTRYDDCSDCFVAAAPPAGGPGAKIVAGVIAGVVTGIAIDAILDDDESDSTPVSPARP